jgi:hypothetical protein
LNTFNYARDILGKVLSAFLSQMETAEKSRRNHPQQEEEAARLSGKKPPPG